MKDPISDCYERLLQIDNRKYESILERLYLYVLEEGDCAIDVGAHVGQHTFPMAKTVGLSGRVYAFEPLPHLYKKLASTINAMPGVCIELSPLALSREKGEVEFLYDEEAPGMSGLMIRQSNRDHRISRIKVNTDLLDNVIPVGKPIKFIKVDAEGADFYILQGATRILSKDRPLVVFESGRVNANPAKSYGYTEDQFNDFFQAQNYVLYDIAGFKYQTRFWEHPTLNDFVAIPREKEAYYREILLAAVLSELGSYAIRQ